MTIALTILKVLGIWTLCSLALVGLWCALRWLSDRRARANVARFGPLRRRKGWDYQREWPIASSGDVTHWHREFLPADEVLVSREASDGEAA